MAVEEPLIIDLSELTSEAADKLADQSERLAEELDNVNNLQKKQPKRKQETLDTDEIVDDIEFDLERKDKKKQKAEKKKDKIAQDERDKNKKLVDQYTAKAQKTVSQIQNPFQTIQSSLLKNLPGFGIIVAATAIITKILTDINNLETLFLNSIEQTLSTFRSNQLQSNIQANLEQLIITDEAGATEVKTAYNNFNRNDFFKQKAESDYITSNTNGFD